MSETFLDQLISEIEVWTLLELPTTKRCRFCKKKSDKFLTASNWKVCLKCYNKNHDLSKWVDNEGIKRNLVDWYLADDESVQFLFNLYKSSDDQYTKTLSGDAKIICNHVDPLINGHIQDPEIRQTMFEILKLPLRFKTNHLVSLSLV